MGLLTEWSRRIQVWRHKPRHWRLRQNTIDRRLFREVVIQNHYQLPHRFESEDIVLDVGAHLGSFSYAALRRGAGRVFCCEPDAGNFALLETNLAPYGSRVQLRRAAVWRSDQTVSQLHLDNPREAGNTGAIQVTDNQVGVPVPALAFDNLVRQATQCGTRKIRLLKLDCEGAEWPILLTSRTLHLVEAIRGEYHLGAYPPPFRVPGFDEYSPGLLARHIRGKGFDVQIQPCIKDPQFGLFLAERKGALFATRAA
jgi:FkbM family methyltransferase